jgi:glutamate N-acetyltransferase / amino-acid N-acetyltransferase
MVVGLESVHKLHPVAGISLSATSAGIYNVKRDDLALICFSKQATVSAVFTKNAFAAAPVVVARQNLASGVNHQYCLINAGNANAGMGDKGIQDTLDTCSKLAKLANCPADSIIPFSTGVIGMDFPVEKINSSIPRLLASLHGEKWGECAKAIMTTDTVSKGISRQIALNGKTVTVTGIAKGSGMIRPDMATMLAFIGTDAVVDKNLLDNILLESVNNTFNRICVDGDMSTNDACILIATGESGHARISNPQDDNYTSFMHVIEEVCEFLAKAIIRDGEGATKFVSINVSGGNSKQECLDVAYTIARSPLVKTAFFASDPNWGRILAAIGYAGLEKLDISGVNIYINELCIVRDGSRAGEYTEQTGIQAMTGEDITLNIELRRGAFEDTVWTCDLSHEYVRINAEYRS